MGPIKIMSLTKNIFEFEIRAKKNDLPKTSEMRMTHNLESREPET